MPRPKKNKQAGDAFKNLLKEKGFSQRRLAKETGLDGGLISKIATGETAEPKTTTLEKIASVLGVDLTELIKIFTQPTVRSHSSEPAENLLLPQADIAAKAAFESSEFLSSDCAIASSPSEDIEALVQNVRSHFNKTIQDECTNLCTFNLDYIPIQRNLTRIYVQTKLNESQGLGSSEFSQERQLWDEVVLNHSKLMVLGKPGAGKTTLLQYIALNCDEIEFQPKLVPIFISLQTLADNAKPPDEIDILGYNQNKYCCSNVSEQELESLLSHGRQLFLVDGLDEVIEEKISNVNSQINHLVDSYSNNRFIVICRKEFQAYQSKKFAHFGFCLVADFEKTQRDDFIKQWLDEVAVIAQPKRSVKANDLIKKLDLPENQGIRELTDTPLLLHLICLIFQARGDLPSKRVELYREAIDLLLEKWNQFNERLHIDVVELKKLLRRIAAITFEAGKSYFEEAEISPLIANCSQNLYTTEVFSGLIVKKGWRQYAFFHQTFQEYLIAEDLVNSQQCWRTLLVHLTETRWREIFFLALEMGKDTDIFLRLFKQGVQDLIDQCEQCWSDESESWVSNIDDSYSGFLDASLTKVNQNLTEVKKDYKIIAIRAFYFMASIIISPVYSMAGEFLAFSSCIYNFSTTKIVELTCTIDCQLSSILKIDNQSRLVSDIEFDYRLVLAFDIASQLANRCSLCNIKEFDAEEFYNLNLELDKALYFNIPLHSLENWNLISSLQQIKNQLPVTNEELEKLREWWGNQGCEWLYQLKFWIIEHRQIVDHLYLHDCNVETAHHYCDINKLLIECLNHGTQVPDELRSHIEDNLFLPLDSSLS